MYFIPHRSPEFDAIVFLLQDETYQMVGYMNGYTYDLSDFTMLNSRLIGLSALFWDTNDSHRPGELGLITDSTSCENGEFTANPFINMSVDVYSGIQVS